MPNINIANDYKIIADIRADAGMVRVRLKDGRERLMHPREAAERAQTINHNVHKLPGERRAYQEKLVEKIIEVCRQAVTQRNDKYNKKAQAMNNLMTGKDRDGKPIKQCVEFEINYYKKKYPLLGENEIYAVLKRKEIDGPLADRILMEENARRGKDIIDLKSQ